MRYSTRRPGKKVDEQLFELREASQTFSFSSTVTGSPDDYVVSLLRGFSAPVTAKQALTQDELLFLASNDDDSLNRWDAAQQIYTRAILDEFTGEASKQASWMRPSRRSARRSTISGGDPSLRALNLAVPGFSELGLKLEDGFDPVKL